MLLHEFLKVVVNMRRRVRQALLTGTEVVQKPDAGRAKDRNKDTPFGCKSR